MHPVHALFQKGRLPNLLSTLNISLDGFFLVKIEPLVIRTIIDANSQISAGIQTSQGAVRFAPCLRYKEKLAQRDDGGYDPTSIQHGIFVRLDGPDIRSKCGMRRSSGAHHPFLSHILVLNVEHDPTSCSRLEIAVPTDAIGAKLTRPAWHDG